MRPKNVRRRKEQHVKPIIGGERWDFYNFVIFFVCLQATTSAGREGMQQTIEHEHTESGIFEVQLVRLVFKTSANF